MVKIAFVQNLAFEYLGTMSLSSMLKNAGHEVEVFIGNDFQKVAEQVKNYKAEILGFSCITGNHHWCLAVARAIKAKTEVLIIFGGPHATFFPEIIMEPEVDAICRGEADLVFLELVNRFGLRKDITGVANCWFKAGSKIIKNDISPFIEDLDSLPFPDRNLYYQKYPYLNKSQKVFLAGRGCPFKCAYCFNEPLQQLYSAKGKYVRYRSVDNLLLEIKSVAKQYGAKTIYMADDTFILNVSWLYEFLDRYSCEIKLPLICLIRVDLLTAEIVKKLKKANCHCVFFGIESGNEQLRGQVLQKDITNEEIINAAALLKRYGIRFKTYNMLGIPGETLDNAWETVRINTQIGADYPWCSILQPYPKTRIEEYARKHNLLEVNKPGFASSFFSKTIMRIKHKERIINLQKLFFFAVKFPFLTPLFRILINFSLTPLYNLFFLCSYAYIYRGSENLKFKEFINLGLKNYRNLLAD